MKRVFETPQKPRFWTHRARPWILGCPKMVKKGSKSGHKMVKKWCTKMTYLFNEKHRLFPRFENTKMVKKCVKNMKNDLNLTKKVGKLTKNNKKIR